MSASRIRTVAGAIAVLAGAGLSPAWAAGGVVGSGTAASCTESAFVTVLANAQSTGGGVITFNCGAAPVIITFTTQKSISSTIELRGEGKVTLTGGNAVSLFQVFTAGRLTVRGMTLTRALGPAGAVENFGVFTMADGRLEKNSSTGSGGAVDNMGVASFTNVVFDGNTAADDGGAIHSAGARVDLVNVEMTANVAGDDGGALAVEAGTVATLDVVRIAGNQAAEGGGIRSAGTMTMRNVTLIGNQASGFGGGMYFGTGTADLTRTQLHFNSAGTRGGGLYHGSGTMNLLDVSVLVNRASTAPGTGGGIRQAGGTLNLRNVALAGNDAVRGGGAALAGGTGTWRNVTMWSNEADDPGAALDVSGGTFTITNATVALNRGVAINRTAGTLTFANSAFAFKDSGDSNCAQALVGATFSLANDATCALGGGRDNRTLEFQPPERLYNGGFTITLLPVPSSPMVDGGSNATCPDGDQRGTARPSGLACDVGAVELVAGEPAKGTAFEFYHAGFDHYFVTIDFNEALQLDSGSTVGWARTGESFDVYGGDLPPVVSARAGETLVPVCRFFSDRFAPKSSHFYAPEGLGCEGTKANADWQFEGNVFKTTLPAADGTCPQGGKPIYRLFNNGLSGAPNHRFTTSTDLRTAMLAKGYIPEGAGIGVGMCSPP